jgi:hypothetical protein
MEDERKQSIHLGCICLLVGLVVHAKKAQKCIFAIHAKQECESFVNQSHQTYRNPLFHRIHRRPIAL